MTEFSMYKESQEDLDRVNQVMDALKNSGGPEGYHVRLEPNQEKDLYFINWNEIKVLWKKFSKDGKTPPMIVTEKPEGEDADQYKETVVFKIYDPAEDKEGFIEFTAISTAKEILEYLRGNINKNMPKTNFLNIMRKGEGKATRYTIRPAK